MDKLLYGDFEEQYTDYETAEIAILPVPYDGTSTWLKGADKGPRAILEASPNMEFYDIETDSEVYKHGIATLEPVTGRFFSPSYGSGSRTARGSYLER